jgi:hypothetical protein
MSGEHWFRRYLRFKPQSIGGDSPYLRRWYVIPHNRFVNVYLHQFLRSDDDRALHDHPWPFISIILKGGYWEHRDKPLTARDYRSAGSIAIRRPSVPHRVELERAFNGHCPSAASDEIPCWTLFITGPKVREWGFWCPRGWTHWRVFDHQNGCGET